MGLRLCRWKHTEIFIPGGIVATIIGDDNYDAVVSLEWRRQGQGSFRPGHPLTHIDNFLILISEF